MRRKGSAANSFAEIVTHLDQLSTGIDANAADLAHLQDRHAKLKTLLGSATTSEAPITAPITAAMIGLRSSTRRSRSSSR